MKHATVNQDVFANSATVSLEQLINLRHYIRHSGQPSHYSKQSKLSGGYRSRIKGRGMDFDEVRVYQPGDDIRNIDWRVTARTSKTHTKVFREEKERPVIIVLDQSPSMYFGSKTTFKSVLACEIASLLAWQGLSHNDKIGGIVFNHLSHQEIKPKRNKHAVLQMLKSAATYNNLLADHNKDLPSEYSLEMALQQLQRIAKPGSAVFVISDFIHYSDECEKILQLTARHTQVHGIKITDPMEKLLPTRGVLTFTDGEKTLQLDTQNRGRLKQYMQHYERRLGKLRHSLNQASIRFSLVSTSDSPLNAVEKAIYY